MPVLKAGTFDPGRIEGVGHGATVSLILDRSEPGQGPRMHRHPYDETWVVREGNVTFQVGEELHRAGPGDVVIIPADAPHKFTTDGPGRSDLVCIHASPTFRTEWLE